MVGAKSKRMEEMMKIVDLYEARKIDRLDTAKLLINQLTSRGPKTQQRDIDRVNTYQTTLSRNEKYVIEKEECPKVTNRDRPISSVEVSLSKPNGLEMRTFRAIMSTHENNIISQAERILLVKGPLKIRLKAFVQAVKMLPKTTLNEGDEMGAMVEQVGSDKGDYFTTKDYKAINSHNLKSVLEDLSAGKVR